MKRFIGMGLSTVGAALMVLSACSVDNQSSKNTEGKADKVSVSEKTTANLSVTKKASKGLQLSSSLESASVASDLHFSLLHCASGFALSNVTGTVITGGAQTSLYVSDTSCEVELLSFVLTYSDSSTATFTQDSSCTWSTSATSPSTCTFTASGKPDLVVSLDQQLPTTISGTAADNAVKFSFGESLYGEQVDVAPTTTTGDITISSEQAPQLSLSSVVQNSSTPMSSGAGLFDIQLDCTSALTSTSVCEGQDLLTMKWALVEDTFSSAPTLANAQSVISSNGALFLSGDLNGTVGAKLSAVAGPAGMHTHPNMILIIQGGQSYRYYNIDVSPLLP